MNSRRDLKLVETGSWFNILITRSEKSNRSSKVHTVHIRRCSIETYRLYTEYQYVLYDGRVELYVRGRLADWLDGRAIIRADITDRIDDCTTLAGWVA